MGGGDDRGRGEEDEKGKRERRQERKRMSRKLWEGVRIEEGEGKEATHGDGGREGGKDLWSGKRFTAYVSLSLSLVSSHSFQDPRTEFRKIVQSYLSKLSSNRNRLPTRVTSAPTEGGVGDHKPNHGITKITRYGVRLVVI